MIKDVNFEINVRASMTYIEQPATADPVSVFAVGQVVSDTLGPVDDSPQLLLGEARIVGSIVRNRLLPTEVLYTEIVITEMDLLFWPFMICFTNHMLTLSS